MQWRRWCVWDDEHLHPAWHWNPPKQLHSKYWWQTQAVYWSLGKHCLYSGNRWELTQSVCCFICCITKNVSVYQTIIYCLLPSSGYFQNFNFNFSLLYCSEIYRWFSIHSRGGLSLVIPNNKTLEQWWLKVMFIAMFCLFHLFHMINVTRYREHRAY